MCVCTYLLYIYIYIYIHTITLYINDPIMSLKSTSNSQ